MQDQAEILAGAETNTGAGASEGEMNPPPEEFITDQNAQWEEFGDPPREQAGEQTEGQPEGAESDDASKAASAAAPEESEEEKAINQQLQAVPETGRFRALRTMLVGAQKQAKEFETELETARGTMFRPTVPAQEFTEQGKAKEFWDTIAKDHPAYYAPMVQDMIRTELTPERLAAGNIPEPTFNALSSVFAEHWLPDFLTKTFGVGVQEFSQIIDRHRSGATNGDAQNGQSGSPSVYSPQELAALNLDPDLDADKPIITELNAARQTAAAANAQSPEVRQLRQQLNELMKAQTGTVKQQQEAAQQERVNAFESMLTADRQGLLEEHLKTRIPRDSTGNIVKGFEHLPEKILRQVEFELSRNEDYKASKNHTVGWFKQPGAFETAKTLAGGDLKKLYAHHKVLIAKIVKEEMTPYADRIRAVNALDKERRTRPIPTGGASPTHETETALRPQGYRGRPPSLAERVKQQSVG